MNMEDPTKPLQFVIAGTGAMARYHVGRFSGFSGVRFVGCYDRSRQRAEEFSQEMGIPEAGADLPEILNRRRVDAVCAAVADPEHYHVVAGALDAGTPVFVEKPFTMTTREAESIVALQQERQVPITVNFSKINYPAILGLVYGADYGMVGAPEHLELSYLQSWLVSEVWGEWWNNPRWLWRISSSHGGGGALRDLGSHLVYLALRIGGEIVSFDVSTSCEASRRAAHRSGFSCDMNDTFVINAEHAGGLRTTIRGSYAASGHTNTVRARYVGSARTLVADTGVGSNSMAVHDLSSSSGRVRHLQFKKVYSTYHSFVDDLRRSRAWDTFSPSASCALDVQRVIELPIHASPHR
ncbi:MAG: Gfo/Idh/MocA family oxidoreductase [Alkalispirochaeta sp.]